MQQAVLYLANIITYFELHVYNLYKFINNTPLEVVIITNYNTMGEINQNRKKKRTIAAVVAVSSIAVILFICIFSLYHLPERDPVRTPDMVENPNYVESPAGDFEETNDIMSASQEEVSNMLGNLEMQYENAKINDEPYTAQQAGLRLALAYYKAGETQQAKDFTANLMQNYSYDENFVGKCKEFLKEIDSQSNE